MWYLKMNLLKTHRSSNPWYLIPSIAVRPSIFRTSDRRIAEIGSVAVVFLCFEFWFCVQNPKRMTTYSEEMKNWLTELRSACNSRSADAQ